MSNLHIMLLDNILHAFGALRWPALPCPAQKEVPSEITRSKRAFQCGIIKEKIRKDMRKAGSH